MCAPVVCVPAKFSVPFELDRKGLLRFQVAGAFFCLGAMDEGKVIPREGRGGFFCVGAKLYYMLIETVLFKAAAFKDKG